MSFLLAAISDPGPNCTVWCGGGMGDGCFCVLDRFSQTFGYFFVGSYLLLFVRSYAFDKKSPLNKNMKSVYLRFDVI